MRHQTFATLSILAITACTGDGSESSSSATAESSTTAESSETGATQTTGASGNETSGGGVGDDSAGSGGASDDSGPGSGDDAGETSTDGGDSGSAESGGELDPLEVCEAYELVHDACLFPQYAREEYCDEYTLGYLEADDACGTGLLELYACLSQLDCRELNDQSAIPCRSTYEDAHEACPEDFGPCAAEDNGWSPDNTRCFYEFTRCLDDSTYRIECEAEGPTSTCSCTIDGDSVGSFDVPTDEPNCYGIDYRLGAEDLCGFPNYLIPLD